MRNKRIFRLVILSSILVLLSAMLASCSSECTHTYGEPSVKKRATCGLDKPGILEYVCTFCGDVKSEEIEPADSHSFKTTLDYSHGCLSDGVRVDECEICGLKYTNNVPPLDGHTYDLERGVDMGKNIKVKCDACGEVVNVPKYVNYDDFGAVGDGIADDSAAIRLSHEIANRYGVPVYATKGKSYRIGTLTEPIIVMTNTDFCGAKIIFDDREIPWSDSALRGTWVYKIVSADAKNATRVAHPAGMTLSRGQTNVGITFDEPCMLRIENSNDKIYKRYGINQSSGTSKYEMILVDKDGNVDPSTPIQYDYSQVTSIKRYSIDDEPLTFGNGYFETLVNDPKSYDPDYENNYCYFARGVRIERSNTTLYKIEHRNLGEDLTDGKDRNGDGIIDIYGADKSYGVPYTGSFAFEACYNSGMEDCILEGHQAYSFFQGANRDEPGTNRNEMGSYDIRATATVNLFFKRTRQYENPAEGRLITNRVMYHGIMATNFSRNITVEDCYFDRFDSHQGVHNATLKNSTFGFGILVIGGGTLYIEDVERVSGYTFISLRADYNSIFDGDVIIKNCVAGNDIRTLISATWQKHDNGLANRVTTSLTVDGLVVKNGSISLYEIKNATVATLTDDINPLVLPDRVSTKNFFALNGTTKIKPTLSSNTDLFRGVEVEIQ